MSILGKLTEGVVSRDMKREGAALLDKWEQTGLLEGLEGDVSRNNMARLLENQAKQLLKEAASSMAGGDVEGFAAVAFPIVRRVFAGLIANDLVSVQPMSLPSGLIFFLDFTFGQDVDGAASRLGFAEGKSLYGGDKVGSEIIDGVDLSGASGENAGQFYNLVNGYTSPTGSVDITAGSPSGIPNNGDIVLSGVVGPDSKLSTETVLLNGIQDYTEDQINSHILRYDPDLPSGSAFAVVELDLSSTQFDYNNLAACASDIATADGQLVRRLTHLSESKDGVTRSADKVRFVFTSPAVTTSPGAQANELLDLVTALDSDKILIPLNDDFTNVSGEIGAVVGQSEFGLENNTRIPEINLQVDSTSVTAQTKKLKAKWTPELGQDLNAYHNLDAEVELTSILSEQIALEIDREILEDLVKGATAATYYWSRSPGLFVNKSTGAEIGASSAAPDFTGTVSEWYETLLETINDVSAQIHRKTLRGGANFLVTSPEVASILEMTSGFRANVTVEGPKGTAGPMNVGSLNKRQDVHVDPYFPRNLILVGRRGGSFLESGYVYAPYVPLQVTPTIFGVEDFVPRKGVMTRYAKKMVRPDMYGLVICRGLLGEAGAIA